jgi:hypothetical protein
MMTNPREVSSIWSSVTKPCYTQPWKHLVDKDMWIVDTGATNHVTYSRIGGVSHCNTTVKTREFIGESINPDLKMDIPATNMRNDGKEIKAELKHVQVNKKFNLNLFSVTRMLQKGYILNTVQDFAGIQLLLLKSTTWHLQYQMRQTTRLQVWKQKKPLRRSSKSMSSGPMSILDT